ncbi:MAG: hypothetical protein U1E22_05795, partial [Coriobacteriia bacterium]|nr:hypothetical protein [Coriobacteriia bacterium]
YVDPGLGSLVAHCCRHRAHPADRFYQITPEQGGKHEGSGLGLSATKRIMMVYSEAVERRA